MRYKQIFLVAVLVLAFGAPTGRGAGQTTLGDIKNSLVCLCECNMTVEACQGSMTCQSAEKLTVEAQQYIEQSLAKDAVLAKFVERYGEHILAAPTKRGFNLMAWVLPFAGIILAGLGIVVVLRKWVGLSQNRADLRLGEAISENGKTSFDESRLDEMLRFLD